MNFELQNILGMTIAQFIEKSTHNTELSVYNHNHYVFNGVEYIFGYDEFDMITYIKTNGVCIAYAEGCDFNDAIIYDYKGYRP